MKRKALKKEWKGKDFSEIMAYIANEIIAYARSKRIFPSLSLSQYKNFGPVTDALQQIIAVDEEYKNSRYIFGKIEHMKFVIGEPLYLKDVVPNIVYGLFESSDDYEADDKKLQDVLAVLQQPSVRETLCAARLIKDNLYMFEYFCDVKEYGIKSYWAKKIFFTCGTGSGKTVEVVISAEGDMSRMKTCINDMTRDFETAYAKARAKKRPMGGIVLYKTVF